MRNRNVKIQIWLSKKEAENLQKKAKRSNISVAVYLRHLINNMVPQDAPPPDYDVSQTKGRVRSTPNVKLDDRVLLKALICC